MLTFVLGFLAELSRETGSWLDRVLPFPRLRRPLRRWRRTRPLWAGLLAVAGGAELMALPMAPLPLMLKVGVGALSAVAIGTVMIAGGLFFLFAPAQRLFVSVVTAVASLTSLATSNLGGLGIGCGLGLLGASMAFGWLPDEAALPAPTPPEPQPTGVSVPVPAAGVSAPKGREGRMHRATPALTLAMPLVLAASLTATAAQHGAWAAEPCPSAPQRPAWPLADVPRPSWPWERDGAGGDESSVCGGEGEDANDGGGAGDGAPAPPPPGGEEGSSEDGKGTGEGHAPEKGKGKRKGKGKGKGKSADGSGEGDPRQKPSEWQLPCLTGIDTGGPGNGETGPPPSEGGTASPPDRTAERGKVDDSDDLTPLRPPLVIGDQPAPGRAEYPVSPRHPRVNAARLDAHDAIVHGSTYLKTAHGRIKVLWVHAERIVARDYHLEVKGPDGTTHVLDVQLDIRNVDVYATYLNGAIEIPKLHVKTPKICIGADVIPANLPVAVQLPVLSLAPIEAGQVLVDTSDVRFSRLSTGQKR